VTPSRASPVFYSEIIRSGMINMYPGTFRSILGILINTSKIFIYSLNRQASLNSDVVTQKGSNP
jgi:hypothetical protein